MSRPVLTIIAGSNGCGKSTLSTYARNELQGAPVLDPDAVARSLQETTGAGSVSNIEAGKQVLELAETLLRSSESVTVETTFVGGNRSPNGGEGAKFWLHCCPGLRRYGIR